MEVVGFRKVNTVVVEELRVKAFCAIFLKYRSCVLAAFGNCGEQG